MKTSISVISHFALALLTFVCLYPLKAACSEETVNLVRGPFTLEQCFQIALQQSPALRAADFEVKMSEDDVKISHGQLLPTVSTSFRFDDLRSAGSDGPSDSDYVESRNRTFRLMATQPLFAGFSIFNKFQKAKIYQEIAVIKKKFLTASHLLDIETLFLELLKAKENVRSYREAVTRLEEDLKAAQARYKMRLIPHVDLLSTEAELADTKQILSQAENDTNVMRIQLNVLLGLPPSDDVEYIGDLADFAVDSSVKLAECTKTALNNRSELVLLEKQLGIAQKDKKIAQYQFAPHVDLSASYNEFKKDYKFDIDSQSPDQKNDYWIVGVTASWDLFKGGSRYHQLNRTMHEISRLKEEIRNQQNQIFAEVKGYFLDLQEAEGRLGVTQHAIKVAREHYNRAHKRYMSSLGTQLEVLKAHDQLTKAEVNVNQSMNDYRIAMAQLKFATGSWNIKN
ncbi:MAG: TolC family protein [Desulfobulbaceae bacterium]|nr:TolC family protein [Desulfobulbaceae bacterium]